FHRSSFQVGGTDSRLRTTVSGELQAESDLAVPDSALGDSRVPPHSEVPDLAAADWALWRLAESRSNLSRRCRRPRPGRRSRSPPTALFSSRSSPSALP